MHRLISVILFLFIINSVLSAQTDTSITEITIIDSYITPELPHILVLSFFTSDSCTSSIKIADKYVYKISEKFAETHKIEIDLSKLVFDSLLIRYKITVMNKDKKESTQIFEVVLNDESYLVKNKDINIFNVCCIGGVFFGLPSPTLLLYNNEKYLALSKEVPVFAFYSGGYNYPSSYISIEYKYIPKFDAKHQLAAGYKKVFQPGFIEYISPGINYFYNFLSGSGYSVELSLGLFKFYSTFTMYARYRFNQFITGIIINYHEVSIGLSSSFFSLNL